MTTLKELHHEALLDKLHELVHAERQVTAELLRVLIEVDRRMLYAERGYSSLFAYCVDVLNMSEPSIGVRIHAARCCSRFPRLLDMLHDGRLHLSAIILLAPRLQSNNFEQLVAMASNKSKRQLQQSLADLNPKPDVPPSIRKLPESKQRADSASQSSTEPAAPCQSAQPAAPCPSASAGPSTPSGLTGCLPATGEAAPALPLQPTGPVAAPAPAVAAPSTPTRTPGPPARSALEPLGNNRYKIQLTASQRLKDKLEQAAQLLQHRIGRTDMPALIECALDRLIAEENKRRHGATDKPRQPRPPRQTVNDACATAAQDSAASTGNPSKASTDNEPRPASRHIPNHVKREVYARDQGQCTFVSSDGHRCSERGGLQGTTRSHLAKVGSRRARTFACSAACITRCWRDTTMDRTRSKRASHGRGNATNRLVQWFRGRIAATRRRWLPKVSSMPGTTGGRGRSRYSPTSARHAHLRSEVGHSSAAGTPCGPRQARSAVGSRAAPSNVRSHCAALSLPT